MHVPESRIGTAVKSEEEVQEVEKVMIGSIVLPFPLPLPPLWCSSPLDIVAGGRRR